MGDVSGDTYELDLERPSDLGRYLLGGWGYFSSLARLQCQYLFGRLALSQTMER